MNLPSFYGVPADAPSFIGTGFDRCYSDAARTDGYLGKVEERIQLCKSQNRTFLNIFMAHPVMLRGVDPWFIFFL